MYVPVATPNPVRRLRLVAIASPFCKKSQLLSGPIWPARWHCRQPAIGVRGYLAHAEHFGGCSQGPTCTGSRPASHHEVSCEYVDWAKQGLDIRSERNWGHSDTSWIQ